MVLPESFQSSTPRGEERSTNVSSQPLEHGRAFAPEPQGIFDRHSLWEVEQKIVWYYSEVTGAIFRDLDIAPGKMTSRPIGGATSEPVYYIRECTSNQYCVCVPY